VFTRPIDTETRDPWRNLVANLAQKHGIPLFQSRQTRGSEGAALLKDLEPDLLLSAAHPTILAPEFLAVPRLGSLNFHGSLLPRNRGTSPVNWALIRDEPETGLTMHFLDEGMDTGDVVYQQLVPIGDDDDPGTLADKVKGYAGPMVKRAIDHLRRGGNLPRAKQDEQRATYAPRLKPDDLYIEWNRPARQVWSFIRGTSQPGLGARTRADSAEFVIWRSVETARAATQPGAVLESNNEWAWISCADKCLQVARAFVEGSEVGAQLRAGTVLK
jgi:methionyl-tRNA formyltransferase